jgi:hypothetical protein
MGQSRVRCIPALWTKDIFPIEKEYEEFKEGELETLNKKGYNIFFFPNYNSKPPINGKNLNTKDIDIFEWVFIDIDTAGVQKSINTKEEALKQINKFKLKPTKIIDSGNGIHAYWRIKDLDDRKYLVLQFALQKHFNSDPNIRTLCRLMRAPGFKNPKEKKFNDTKKLFENDNLIYKTTELLEILPKLSTEDDIQIQTRLCEKYDITIENKETPGKVPDIVQKLFNENPRIKEVFDNKEGDRSQEDMKLANALLMAGISREDAYSTILAVPKRKHKAANYHINTVDKVYNNPLTVKSFDYSLIQALFEKQQEFKQKQEVILNYKLDKEYKKTLKEIEIDKRKGVYSLKGTEEIRKKVFTNDILNLRGAVKNRLFCITEGLTQKVPLLGTEVIFLAGESGKGKTSTLVGIVAPLIKQEKSVLVISNEERGSDIAMRIAAIQNGWNINERYEWKDDSEIWSKLEEKCIELANSPYLTILDNYMPGKDFHTGKEIDPLDTTYIQQFQAALEAVERDEKHYDLLVLDYMSKIINTEEPNGQAWAILKRAITFVEEFSKRNKIPSIVFTQLRDKAKTNEGKEVDEPIKDRLEGSKQMYNAVQNVIELITDYDSCETTWKWHKTRYGQRHRHALKFDRGMYFDLDNKKNK